MLGTRRDIPQLLAATDVCFLTSISEGIPLTLIEGMAASLPVVATNVGGVSEVVHVGKTGYLAPAKDVDAIAQQLIQLCHDPAQRIKMGATGRERAERLFSEQLMHQKYSELFQKMG